MSYKKRVSTYFSREGHSQSLSFSVQTPLSSRREETEAHCYLSTDRLGERVVHFLQTGCAFDSFEHFSICDVEIIQKNVNFRVREIFLLYRIK